MTRCERAERSGGFNADSVSDVGQSVRRLAKRNERCRKAAPAAGNPGKSWLPGVRKLPYTEIYPADNAARCCQFRNRLELSSRRFLHFERPVSFETYLRLCGCSRGALARYGLGGTSTNCARRNQEGHWRRVSGWLTARQTRQEWQLRSSHHPQAALRRRSFPTPFPLEKRGRASQDLSSGTKATCMSGRSPRGVLECRYVLCRSAELLLRVAQSYHQSNRQNRNFRFGT